MRVVTVFMYNIMYKVKYDMRTEDHDRLELKIIQRRQLSSRSFESTSMENFHNPLRHTTDYTNGHFSGELPEMTKFGHSGHR